MSMMSMISEGIILDAGGEGVSAVLCFLTMQICCEGSDFEEGLCHVNECNAIDSKEPQKKE